LAQGGTAVGTGLNCDRRFPKEFLRQLRIGTGVEFAAHPNYFEAISSQDTAVELSGQLRVIAVSITKIANDLRWMNSGPWSGLAEIALPALQPGSSIMPGKVNPVVPEATVMIAAQVIGNDATIAIAGQSGNFQLNVMLPVLAYNLIQSIELLALACRNLADRAIAGFEVNEAHIVAALSRNPLLATALNPLIGYDLSTAIVKRAYAEGRAIIDVAAEMSNLSVADLERLMDPAKMTHGGGRD
jgi:fumarate hydratase, class II